MDKDNKLHGKDNPAIKKKPPKLKNMNRSISVAIENYTPGTSLMAPMRIIDSQQIETHPLPPPQKIPSPSQEIYILSGRSTSPSRYDHASRKQAFRRSDTLDVHSPRPSYQMKAAARQLILSRRTSSVRAGTYLFPPTLESRDRSPSPSRRGCRTHRSFIEPSRHHMIKPSEIDIVKHQSLSDEIVELGDDSIDTMHLSVEKELPRSRSNSHTNLGDENETTIISVAIPSTSGIRKGTAHKHSSHSLDQQQQQQQQHQQQYSFKRNGKHTHSLYLSPNSLEELQVHRPHNTDIKKSHSSSMRIRPYRENLVNTKKSKSFMSSNAYPEFELSPHRRDSRILSTDEIKRSPRPSTLHIATDEKRSSFERKTSSANSYDIDFDPMAISLRPFRSSRRTSSITGSVRKLKKQSMSEETDEDADSDRKRKKIACIIMTVFFCLVCASIFVVIITLTHSSFSQTHPNQNKKITQPPSRDSPIHHHNVRQENERLMHESMNRARLAKNYTEYTASLAALDSIP